MAYFATKLVGNISCSECGAIKMFLLWQLRVRKRNTDKQLLTISETWTLVKLFFLFSKVRLGRRVSTPSVSSLKFRERTLCIFTFKNVKPVKGCAQKLGISSLCVEPMVITIWKEQSAPELIKKYIRSRYCIFESSGGCESVTGRRNFKCREPLKTSCRVKIGAQNNRTIRCLFKRSTGNCFKVVYTLQVQKKVVLEWSTFV